MKVDDPGAVVRCSNEKGDVLIEHRGENGSVTIGVATGKGRLRLVKDGVQVAPPGFLPGLGREGDYRREARANPRAGPLEKQGEEGRQQPSPAVGLLDAKQAKEQQAVCAKHLGVPVEITNSIGMKLALIPSGEFQMGSPAELIDAELRLHGYNGPWARLLPGELPQHRVRITKPYRLGVTEVTQEQYQRVMGVNPSKFQGDPNRPVEQVSWDDAVEFCRRLSELPGEKAVKRHYGLPTEAQWEYACRAGSTVPLQSKADPSARLEEEKILRDYAWFGANSDGQTHAVGQKRANAFGLNNMHGNVAEWCAGLDSTGLLCEVTGGRSERSSSGHAPRGSGRELARPPLRMPRDGPLHRPARVEGPQRGLPGRPISSGQVRRASGACSGDPEGATAGQAQPE